MRLGVRGKNWDQSGGQLAFDGMRPVLSVGQEVYAQQLAQGAKQRDAWAVAFPGRKWTGAGGSIAANNELVKARVQAIRADVAAMHLWDRLQAVEALKLVVTSNRGSASIVPAVKALNEMVGIDMGGDGFGSGMAPGAGSGASFSVTVNIVEAVRLGGPEAGVIEADVIDADGV